MACSTWPPVRIAGCSRMGAWGRLKPRAASVFVCLAGAAADLEERDGAEMESVAGSTPRPGSARMHCPHHLTEWPQAHLPA